ncbi:lysosomal acid phosphatase isoform X2 [Athalia rosae]|nr:lysosomal acid phosphatase isoform X2 [Athalia rosae]
MESRGGFLRNSCRSGRRGICVSVAITAAIIGCVLLAYTAFANSAAETVNNLQQVAIIFRHGDKNPTETYPNDPWADYDWPDGWGALTKKGMLQMYTLGERLRAMYGPFLGNKYKSTDLLVRSSYADRCIMSAQVLLAALYQPTEEDLFIPGLPWRPIPVHSIPRNIDKLIVSKAPCPKLDKELAQAYLNFSKTVDDSFVSMCKELTTYTGHKIETILDVELLFNTLEIESEHGLELPKWALKYYDEKMRGLAAKSLALFTSNLTQRRLRGGNLLKEILEKMVMRRNGTDTHKMYLYSAHDTTLVNTLRAMGFTEELLKPEHGASLIFELHVAEGGQNHEIKILYLNNTEITEPHSMNVPGCPGPCMIDTLFKIWEPVLPRNWERECSV